MPRITVILPVHNAGAHLPMALASLLAQTLEGMEVLALDDGSTDGSGEVLQVAAELDPRVRVVSRPQRGLVATLNDGLTLARTDLIARMDADDIAWPDRLAAQAAEFAARPGLGILGTNFTTLYRPDRVIPPAPAILTGEGERAVLARFCTPLRHPTVMFRQSAIPSGVLRYDPAYPHAEDFDLFRRLAEVTGLAELPAPYLAYRLHPGSVSVTKAEAMAATHLRILSETVRRHYPGADGSAALALATCTDLVAVEGMADLVRALDGLADRQPPAEREAFDVGVTNIVHFTYALLCRRHAYALAHQFVRQARRARSVRRREMAILRTPFARWGMGLSEGHAGMVRRLSSRPLAGSIPGFDRIHAIAERISARAAIRRDWEVPVQGRRHVG